MRVQSKSRSTVWSSVWPTVLLLSGVLGLTSACAGGARHSKRPGQELIAAGWIDDVPLGDATAADVERLAVLAESGLQGRILRLDRLIDLYDAARFAGDRQAREVLWASLGGHSSTRGIEASREAVMRMLDEAYAIEDGIAEPGGEVPSEDQQRFVADAIMLLSTDMFLPDTAESLITASLAYRVLSEGGHPRVADNAHWRLYDHVRGVLEGATEVGPAARADVLVHALYIEREDISAWLEDVGPHAKPPLPSPAQLWAMLEQHRELVGQQPRWAGVVAARTSSDASLRDTVMDLLPRPREATWPLIVLPRGTAMAESLAPVVQIEPGRLRLEPSSEHPREFDPAKLDDALTSALEGLLARDGRGVLLWASAADVPAPEYAAGLRALAAARTTTIELAVREPAVDTGAEDVEQPGSVVVALPLHVAAPDDASAGARALRDSRIHVQLTGRGPRVRVDGRWLSTAPTLPSDLVAFIDDLRRAYPRQYAVSLALGEDVQHQQLVDLLAALAGGRSPVFVAVGWMPDAAIERTPAGDPAADKALQARVKLAAERIEISTAIPAEATELERSRLTSAIETLRACVPELEAELPQAGKAGSGKVQGLELRLHFVEQELQELHAEGRKLPKAGLERVEACARDRLAGFRLREHQGVLDVVVRVQSR